MQQKPKYWFEKKIRSKYSMNFSYVALKTSFFFWKLRTMPEIQYIIGMIFCFQDGGHSIAPKTTSANAASASP